MSMRVPFGLAAAILVLSGCGGGSSQPSASATPAKTSRPEINPAGDIPDNQAYVPYRLPAGGVSVKVPEGWGRTTIGGAAVFSDKLNSVRIETRPTHGALSVSTAKRSEVPPLAHSVK